MSAVPNTMQPSAINTGRGSFGAFDRASVTKKAKPADKIMIGSLGISSGIRLPRGSHRKTTAAIST